MLEIKGTICHIKLLNAIFEQDFTYPGRGFWVNFRKKCGECGEFS